MAKKEIKLLCTDGRCEQRESYYVFKYGNNKSDSCEFITNIRLITNDSIDNKDLGEILNDLIKLNKKQNQLGYMDPGLFSSGTYV